MTYCDITLYVERSFAAL